MSLAHLRSASPVHLEYLRNMGSAATLTISILRGDLLWGLIACHHATPRRMSSATCVALELFAQVFSLQLEAREQANELAEVARAHAVLDALRNASAERPIGRAIDTIRRELADILPHDGVASWIGGEADRFGSTPPADRLPELVRYIAEVAPDGIFASSRLSAGLPDALRYTAEASGVLAVPLSRGRHDFLMFFRKEEIQTLTWGGDPNKPVTRPLNGGRIGPRQSFSAWKEIVRGASLPWRDVELHVAEALQVRVLEFMLSHARIVDDSRRAAAKSQSLLIAELGHRVKNIFALIRSVVRQSRASASSIEDYARDLERRIGALAVAHDQVTHVGWRPASLRRLLEEQARTWSTDGTDRVVLSGPPVLLDVRAVQAFALVLHEMITNAAKYGALSVPQGLIRITWSIGDEGLSIAWRESRGPRVQPSERRGFGSIVIEQTVPFELKGSTKVRYPPSGVEADFVIPAAYATATTDDDGPRKVVGPIVVDLKGERLLLVEDSMMIALDAQAALEAIGASVEIVASVADGLRAIELNHFTMAVLDVNLRGETSEALADALLKNDVPFIFATGYGDQINIPEQFRHVPKVSKPYDAVAIADAIELVKARSSGLSAP